MTPEPEFDFPEIHVGDRVEVSNDPTEGDKTLGLIRKVKTRSADILAFYGGVPMLRLSCLHVNDPRCENRPDVFIDHASGVFRLAHSERLIQDVSARLSAIEALQEALVGNVSRLEDPVVAASAVKQKVKPKADPKTPKTGE